MSKIAGVHARRQPRHPRVAALGRGGARRHRREAAPRERARVRARGVRELALPGQERVACTGWLLR